MCSSAFLAIGGFTKPKEGLIISEALGLPILTHAHIPLFLPQTRTRGTGTTAPGAAETLRGAGVTASKVASLRKLWWTAQTRQRASDVICLT